MDDIGNSSGEASLKLIKQWIFEHACKYGMDEVMRAIFQNKGNKSLTQLSDDAAFVKPNPAFMFVTLVEVFQETLKTELTWDNALLIMITEILEDLYRKQNFVPIKRFMNAVTRLKLMELLKLMADRTESSIVVRRVNTHFPRWDKKIQKIMQKDYKICNMISLKKAEKTMVACRQFILGLLVSKDKWRNYQQNSYNVDIKQFAETVNKELIEITKVLRPELPPSPIEQILNGAKEDLANSDDVAIQILLEHLHVGMEQTDFLKLLTILEPETESQINPQPFAHILDGITESTSNIEETNIISDEESDASTVLFCDEASAKKTDYFETLTHQQKCQTKSQSLGKPYVMFPDDSSNDETSLPKLILNDDTCKCSPVYDKENNEDKKEQNAKRHKKRKRRRLQERFDVIIPSSKENSEESEIEILPDLGYHLARECTKPCTVKLYKLMVRTEDDIKYQIYS